MGVPPFKETPISNGQEVVKGSKSERSEAVQVPARHLFHLYQTWKLLAP